MNFKNARDNCTSPNKPHIGVHFSRYPYIVNYITLYLTKYRELRPSNLVHTLHSMSSGWSRYFILEKFNTTVKVPSSLFDTIIYNLALLYLAKANQSLTNILIHIITTGALSIQATIAKCINLEFKFRS